MAEIKFVDLTIDHAVDFCAVLDAIGVDQIIKSFDAKEVKMLAKKGASKKELGAVILMKLPPILLRNLPKAREEMYSFFASCMIWDNDSAVTADEIRKLKLTQFAKLLQEFVESQKGELSDFFGAVAKLFGMEKESSLKSYTGDTATPRAI